MKYLHENHYDICEQSNENEAQLCELSEIFE